MKQLVALALVIASSSGIAVAEDEKRIAVRVRVGETVTTEVGFAMGHVCDDERVVLGEMRNKNAETNVFAATGLAAGKTLCRVGTLTVEARPTFLFEITVVPAERPPAGPRPRR